MQIDILLPFKEKFSMNAAGAVSLTVKNTMKYSKYFNNIRIFGQHVTNPFFEKNFHGLNNNWILHGGHNKSLAYHYYKKNLNESFKKKIIEIHNRPYIFNYLIKKIPNFPMTLHFHNNPQQMKGSKSIKEREFITKSASAVYFVSKFIKNKFIEGLSKNYNNLHVLYNSVERNIQSIPNKKKEILFVGRLVPEKGAHIFCESIKTIAKKFKDWNFTMIGSSQLSKLQFKSKYEKKLISEFNNINFNTNYLGYIENDKVLKKIMEASILVIPSLWDEPFSLAAIEGLSQTTVIISSNRGGLPEVIGQNGILLENLNEKNLKEKILELILNKNLIHEYQQKAWNNYKFNSSELVKKQDFIRSEILKNYYSN